MPLFSSRTPLALLGVAALVTVALTAAQPAAHAQISYRYSTLLALYSGTDALGLDGASALVRFLVPTGATYVERSGLHAVVVSNATVTFTGASVAQNNGTFSLGGTAFYADFAGFFTEPDALFHTVDFPVGGSLLIGGNTVATPSGENVQVGDFAQASDFGPTTNVPGTLWYGSNGAAYDLNNTVITATPAVVNPIPEPSEYAAMGMAGFALCGLMVRAQRKSSGGAKKAPVTT